MKLFISFLFKALIRKYIMTLRFIYVISIPLLLIFIVIIWGSVGLSAIPDIFETPILKTIFSPLGVILFLTFCVHWYRNKEEYGDFTGENKVTEYWKDFKYRNAGEIWKLNYEIEKLGKKQREIREVKKSLEEDNKQIERKVEGLKDKIRKLEESYK